jgi:hypothetical protein
MSMTGVVLAISGRVSADPTIRRRLEFPASRLFRKETLWVGEGKAGLAQEILDFVRQGSIKMPNS